YDVFLKAGYPIATGVIEGACGSLVKERTDCSGMRWTKKGIQAVLDLRALKRNGDWDNYWKYHIDCEKQRLYAA
ncbi:MAG: ISKra4 family transposase, partial [Candidatus Electryonea clarkiae]|nr:ISKra4 family transposase [Candidatus Electryonea clarkiae]